MPGLTLAPVGGTSSTGHLDAGLMMATTLTMDTTVFMRGESAFGDMDLMAPFYLNAFGGSSVTSILITTAMTEVVPGPFAAVSTTSTIVFAAPVIPDLTASASTTSLSVTARDLLSISSASVGQTLILVTAPTLVFTSSSASQGQMVYPLPFSAGPVLGISPSASLSSMSANFTAITGVLPDAVQAQSATVNLPLVTPIAITGSVAALSTASNVVRVPIPFVPDPTFSTSTTNYAIPYVVIELTSAGMSFSNLFMLVPHRVASRKVRGAGARRIELVGGVPLGG